MFVQQCSDWLQVKSINNADASNAHNAQNYHTKMHRCLSVSPPLKCSCNGQELNS